VERRQALGRGSGRLAQGGLLTGLWDWALEAYARPGAADACLALQDEHRQNVPLLLWVIWAAVAGRGPDDAALKDGADVARAWQTGLIGPVRDLRRRLTAPMADVREADRGAIRAQVKTTELDAERRLLAALEPLAFPPPGAKPVERLLARASEAYGAPLPPSAFAPLLRCLNLQAASQ
jgi:uncharacterized protein (TIGR02444 family)